jgi:hypothetical protein
VKTEPDVRKARKHLLSELGVLASLAKRANSMSNIELTEETELEIEALGEAIQSRTERLVNRANRLLEIATPLTELWKEEDMYIPPTPPISGGTPGVGSFEFSAEHSGMNWEYSGAVKAGGRQGSIATTGANSSASVASSISDDNPDLASQQMSNWALNRLNATHDILLSHLAAYIGRLHLQSRSPGQIFETTNQCVIGARNFLGVVRAITNRKGNRLSSTGALEQSSNLLWNKCTTLVNVAREVVSSHGVGETDEDVVMDGEVRKLVEAATACVRSAGECVALGHCLLDAIGDFELPVPAVKLNRDSLMSLGPAEEYPGTRRSSISSQPKRYSKQLPPPPALSDDNPRRPLPSPPRNQSPIRKVPPKLKLVSSHAYSTGRTPITPGFSSARSGQHSASPSRYSSELSPGDVLKFRDADAQSKFLATLPESVPTDSIQEQPQDVESLRVLPKPEIVEPPLSPKTPHQRQISLTHLRRDSLFHTESDEALRLADTLTMPRTGSSGSSSNGSGVDVADERSMKSVPTSPEPGTPVKQTHQLEPIEVKTVILNNEGQVYDFEDFI